MLIEARPPLDPELAALVAAQQHEGGSAFRPDDRAAYFVGLVDGRAVACGAWQPLPESDVAELNRLYVRPSFRGRGLARQMIVTIEEEALAASRPVMRLTAALSPAAIALFQSSGYHLVAGRDVLEKRLVALVQ
ncbi:GNAT family N-acetyltransferase [Paractinoplanes lichenicola]|uniref:GNAT family N-acetyltransferase n=1 Tax=Paractinoplanes lichenicola TaxID=2802976 RepID=A0ABS1VMX5_9ACTN|nr:GNAT family N-acetyltransferase [Actinoplanes lichenicola]MBL7256087.1 GNAT family N-acetyltransferase [Actinoplanes lichenicola]